jgi:predicted Rossmann fold flavoprotein
MKIAIVGGGASGMAAALAALENPENQVVIYERQARLGRKLLATGNGRCNLTNLGAHLSRYHGRNPAFAGPALERFGPQQTLEWFGSLGLMTAQEDSGRVYPLSNAAGSVLDVLRLALEARGASSFCASEVAAAGKAGQHFWIATPAGDEQADRLIVACGGMAGAKVGGGKSGYTLLAGFGHTRTELRPSLVQLRCDNTWTKSLKGVRTGAFLTLERDGLVLGRAEGEVQFTDYGLSGPAVFDLSRAASFAGDGAALALDLLPGHSKVDIMHYIEEKCADFPDYTAENLLTGTLHNSICRAVVRRAEIPTETRLWALSAASLEAVAGLVKRYELPLRGTLGFEEAQVTAGGVETAGFYPLTLESRLVPGLYACGEVLDIDGDCGGFNLQWAWSSGRLAGLSAGGISL